MFRRRFIAFIFIFAIISLGCNQNKTHKEADLLVKKLPDILLTAHDLPTMEMDLRHSYHRPLGPRGNAPQPPAVDRLEQEWEWEGLQAKKSIDVTYWLFKSVADAQEAGSRWTQLYAEPYMPEPIRAEVIGDATWYPVGNAAGRIDSVHLWFAKNNVLVSLYIRQGSPKGDQRPLARSLARKVVTKIEAASAQP